MVAFALDPPCQGEYNEHHLGGLWHVGTGWQSKEAFFDVEKGLLYGRD
jgi:hypothetical protein